MPEISSFSPSGIAAPPNASAFRNAALIRLVKEQFSILTPENELKPDFVLDVQASKSLVRNTGDETSVAVHFDSAKGVLSFAKANGMKVHGHVLVWHSQTPEEFFHEGYDRSKPQVSREVMLGRLENYIREVLTKTEEMYPGVIVSWDVVNEAIDDGTNWLRKTSPWTRTIGEDHVLRAFEFARKYAPEGVLLYYNDYNTPVPAKLAGITKLLKQLMEEGNIDGYGFQMHYSNNDPSIEQISKARFKEIMQLMLQYADQTEAVQVWGLTDDMSWRTGQYALLFDSNRNPKPAFYGVLEAAQP